MESKMKLSNDVDNYSDDVEEEDIGQPSGITHPFDPQTIKIKPETINLGAIIENLENDEIDLSPAFQRKSGLWDNIKKSRLIESLILGLPLPAFFFSAETFYDKNKGKKTERYVVVDGLQRLSTIKEFVIDKSFKLENLEFLSKTHNKMGYDDLSREEHRKIKGSRITISTIEESNPPLVKYIVFRRINTGGLHLNEQEIRHALNQGVATELLNSLARTIEFISATSGVIKTDRMEDREFINRFIAFYIMSYTEYDGDLDLFLANALIKLSNFSVSEISYVKNSFLSSMRLCVEIFGDDSFRKPKTGNRKKPISKALFDTVSVNFAKLKSDEQIILIKNKNVFMEKFNSLFENDSSFHNSISNATGTTRHVTTRFSKVENVIFEVIGDA